MNYSIRFTIPNGQVDPRLAGNSRYSALGKSRLTKKNRKDAFTLAKHCLDGVTGEEFLTNCGQHPIEDAFPVTLVCRRVYTGMAQIYDDDNIRLAFKAYRDGICDALEISDAPRYLTGQYPQERRNTRGGDYLEFELYPAWTTANIGLTA
jgi:hypothetical protein